MAENLLNVPIGFQSICKQKWCNEDIMIHYNNNNNAYCGAVNAKKIKTIEHNIIYISTLLCTWKPHSYSYVDMFICIYSVRGAIDQLSTNTFRYSTCCAANVCTFVYTFIGAPIVPLEDHCKDLSTFLLNPQKRFEHLK